jgi:UDP-hydrolysing UDP-N-acetyl-D-glucosamine 2-epimerase
VRKIGVVTVGRSDYGILRPLLWAIDADEELELALYVGGAHLAPEHGETVREIEADGFTITERVEPAPQEDTAAAVAQALGRGVAAFAGAFERTAPDLVVLLGDRYEMLAAAVAAVPLRLPLAHVHGGESSEGAFDEAIRHALTKLSHLHFASAEEHARRIRQLGEEPWRIVVSGAPGLDAIRDTPPLDDPELEQRVGMRLNGRTLIVTYHPATLDPQDPAAAAEELVAAVEQSGLPAVFTFPNADPGSSGVRAAFERYARRRDDATVVANLGSRAYFALMRRAAAMVGNSSSGIVEAPSFELPVVNVGIRQQGRLRAANVIDVASDRASILAGIRRAVSPEFRASLAGLENPYGDGRAAERIVDVLKRVELGPKLLQKRFVDAGV